MEEVWRRLWFRDMDVVIRRANGEANAMDASKKNAANELKEMMVFKNRI